MIDTSSESKSSAKIKRRLRIALAELLKANKNKDKKITVSQIAERAEISRATFYLYYSSYEEFYDDTVKNLFTACANQIAIFASGMPENAKEVSKKKNLVLKSDELELVSVILKDNFDMEIVSDTMPVVFMVLNERTKKVFGDEFVKENQSRLNFFGIGFVATIMLDFIDYDQEKTARDLLRSCSIWKALFAENESSAKILEI